MAANMNVGWETVGGTGKPIKKIGSEKQVAKKEAEAKKRFVEKAPKLEDVLPYGEVASAYSAVFDVARSKLPQTNGSKSPKKPEKKPEKKPDKKETPKEDPKPKTLEEAAKKISAPHLKHLLLTTKTSFPGDPFVWTRDAAAYLNLTLTFGSSELTPADFQHFSQKPLSVLNKETKKTLSSLLDECGESVRVSLFETFLANLAHDMAKGQSVQGYLIMLQLLSDINPSLCLLRGSTNRFVELRNSYQNRPNIGTALLWAVGLGGKKDLQTGLKVWIEFMLPLLTLRNYSKFIVDYLKSLLKLHNAVALGKVAKSQDGSRILYPVQFFQLFDAVFLVGPSSLNKEAQAELAAQYTVVKALAIGNCDADHELFPEFLRRLEPSLTASPAQPALQTEILTCLEQCLVGGSAKAALSHWRQMYRAHLPSSARLLQHLDAAWDKSVSRKLSRDSTLEDLIEAFQEYNEGCSQQKEGIALATASAQSLLKKMSRRSDGSGWFLWKTSSLLLLVGITYLLQYDVTKHGSFEASNTGRFLKDVGLYNQTVETYEWTMFFAEDVRDWSNANLPVFTEKARQTVGPLIDSVGSGINSGITYVKTNIPYLTDKVNEYIPGIKEKLVLFGEEVWNRGEAAVAWIREHGLCCLESAAKKSVEAVGQGLELAKKAALAVTQVCKDIFDGKIDLKDVKESAISAFESTTDYASNAYQWTLKQIKS